MAEKLSRQVHRLLLKHKDGLSRSKIAEYLGMDIRGDDYKANELWEAILELELDGHVYGEDAEYNGIGYFKYKAWLGSTCPATQADIRRLERTITQEIRRSMWDRADEFHEMRKKAQADTVLHYAKKAKK